MKQIRKLNFQAMLQPRLSNNGCYNVFAIICKLKQPKYIIGNKKS